MKHTKGPWRWELSERQKRLQLCGGEPVYDLTVMDFVRWGMGGAIPRFRDDVNKMNIMRPAREHAQPVAGREHHANWFQFINHPDALLIAAAPDLLEALLKTKEYLETELPEQFIPILLYNEISKAIEKATFEAI